jgi:hypothetical protein
MERRAFLTSRTHPGAGKLLLPFLQGMRELGYIEGRNLVLDWRRSVAYVDKILRGASPGELPVQQPMTLSLVVNQRTANVLQITIPKSVLVRAERVIE